VPSNSGALSMRASAWTSFLVPIAIGLLLALFRRLCPTRVADGADPTLTDEERRVYVRWEVGEIVPFFILAPLLGFAWYFALKGAAGQFQHVAPGTRFLVRPTSIYWAIPAIFLGIISPAVPIEWLYRCLLRERYRRFERDCNERMGFDGRRAFAWLAAFVAIGSSVGFVAGVTSFARFDEAGIEIGRPLSFRSKFYTYKSVTLIEHRATVRAPNGNIVQRPHFVIDFDDGTSWSCEQLLRDPEPELDARIAQLVAQKSGRRIIEQP
jgi:hypothetical protein